MRTGSSGDQRPRRKAGRWVAATSAVVVAAMLLTSPAGAHVSGSLTHLISHLKKVFYSKSASDARYYTRAQADTTFARVGQIRTIRVDTPTTGNAADPGAGVPVLARPELTVRGHCETSGPAYVLRLAVTSSVAANLNMTYSQVVDDGAPNVQQKHLTLAANTPQNVFLGGGTTFEKIHSEGQLVYNNSRRVITALFHSTIDNLADRCQVMGTAVSP